jgi:hypothetical protein
MKRQNAAVGSASEGHVQIPRTLPFQRRVKKDQQERAAVFECCATQFRALDGVFEEASVILIELFAS